MALPIPIPAASPEEMCFVRFPFVDSDGIALWEETSSPEVLGEELLEASEVLLLDEDRSVEIEGAVTVLEAEFGAMLVVCGLADAINLVSEPGFSEEFVIKHMILNTF